MNRPPLRQLVALYALEDGYRHANVALRHDVTRDRLRVVWEQRRDAARCTRDRWYALGVLVALADLEDV